MPGDDPLNQVRALYDRFDSPVTGIDCGTMCAPHNPTGKPFCCDICQAIPAAYSQEWAYVQQNTDLWHIWRGDECPGDPTRPEDLRAATPDHMLLLACQGPSRCRREFRLVSCRQFPFFPYITSDLRFIGLAYDWEFESACWVISHLGQVSEEYRDEFVRMYDALFAAWQAELESYAIRSEEMRAVFQARKRRIPILHRSGDYSLLSPGSERLRRVSPESLKRFGPYQEECFEKEA